MRNTLNDEELKYNVEGCGREKIEDAVQETLEWLGKNQLAERDALVAKRTEIEGVVNSILTNDRMAQEAGKFRAEGESHCLKIGAKNGLEDHCFTMRGMPNEEMLKG